MNVICSIRWGNRYLVLFKEESGYLYRFYDGSGMMLTHDANPDIEKAIKDMGRVMWKLSANIKYGKR